MQLDNLELKLAESRRKNHNRWNALQQVEKTIVTDAALVKARLDEQTRLQQQLELPLNSTSQFQRSYSFDSESRSKSKYSTTERICYALQYSSLLTSQKNK